jgi:hypothetical protein
VEEILNDDNTPNEYEDNPSIQNTPKSVKVKELSFSPSSKNGKDKNYETLKESSHDDVRSIIDYLLCGMLLNLPAWLRCVPISASDALM